MIFRKQDSAAEKYLPKNSKPWSSKLRARRERLGYAWSPMAMVTQSGHLLIVLCTRASLDIWRLRYVLMDQCRHGHGVSICLAHACVWPGRQNAAVTTRTKRDPPRVNGASREGSSTSCGKASCQPDLVEFRTRFASWADFC